jgi:bifunctional non-homologous end joining protein LigD
LEAYRNKRDFEVTPEPAGSLADPAPGNRFVVQRHRARRLHYDLRLEAHGVLLSWAVPRGPTLDPDAKRMAVHVEDHPLDYFDFEGVIPKGEYGGGDVVVWDWGEWTLADAKDPLAAVEAGILHFDLHGEKLAGRFVLVRTGRGSDRREQWLLIHKHDEFAVAGWDADDHPQSVKTGRTNDEVAHDRDVTWHRDRASSTDSPSPEWREPDPEALAALNALKSKGRWQLGERELTLTNLDKILFPPTDGSPGVTKRDLIRYYTCMAPHMSPYLVDRPVKMHCYPDGADRPGFWQRSAPEDAPEWIRRWRHEEADPGESEPYVILDSAAALAWAANFGAVELHPWTSTAATPQQPSWALIDIDPGDASTFDDVLVLARLYRAALDHLNVRACPKVTGQRGVQIWVPVGAGYSFDETRRWVERVSRAVGAMTPELVSWDWSTRNRCDLIRLDYTQNAMDKSLVAPFSARPRAAAPVSVPIDWDELQDPALRPDSWTVHTARARFEGHGDPLAEMVGLPQRLPKLSD